MRSYVRTQGDVVASLPRWTEICQSGVADDSLDHTDDVAARRIKGLLDILGKLEKRCYWLPLGMPGANARHVGVPPTHDPAVITNACNRMRESVGMPIEEQVAEITVRTADGQIRRVF